MWGHCREAAGGGTWSGPRFRASPPFSRRPPLSYGISLTKHIHDKWQNTFNDKIKNVKVGIRVLNHTYGASWAPGTVTGPRGQLWVMNAVSFQVSQVARCLEKVTWPVSFVFGIFSIWEGLEILKMRLYLIKCGLAIWPSIWLKWFTYCVISSYQGHGSASRALKYGTFHALCGT